MKKSGEKVQFSFNHNRIGWNDIFSKKEKKVRVITEIL